MSASTASIRPSASKPARTMKRSRGPGSRPAGSRRGPRPTSPARPTTRAATHTSTSSRATTHFCPKPPPTSGRDDPHPVLVDAEDPGDGGADEVRDLRRGVQDERAGRRAPTRPGRRGPRAAPRSGGRRRTLPRRRARACARTSSIPGSSANGDVEQHVGVELVVHARARRPRAPPRSSRPRRRARSRRRSARSRPRRRAASRRRPSRPARPRGGRARPRASGTRRARTRAG